jgi:hypothetical protein
MDDPDTPSEAEEEAYALFCLLLGEFFHTFTAVEAELNYAIYVAVTRLSKRMRAAPMLAVLGGLRMSPAKDTIKRLLRATRASERRKDFVDALFHQLGEIQFFRDRLSHHATVISSDNPAIWINMNFGGIKELHQMEDISFHLETLRAATADLQVIRTYVAGFFNHHVRRGSAATPKPPAWQYKPSMLIRDRPISSGSPRSRKLRPRSSSKKR